MAKSYDHGLSALRSRAFGFAVLAATLILLVFSWHTHFQNIRLRHRIAELLKAREYPQVITGLRLDVLQHTTLLEKWPTAGPSARRKLLLVTSDTCGFCKKNIPNWLTLLTDLKPVTSQEVWLITFNTHSLTAPLVRVLKEKNIPFRILSIDDSILFSLKTGIIATPMTVLLEEDFTVSLVCSGQLGDREISIFGEHWSGTGQFRKIFLTSSDRRTNDIARTSPK